MRPLEPSCSGGTEIVVFAAEATAFTGLAALETVADFEVFLIEGKPQSYLASQDAVIQPRGK